MADDLPLLIRPIISLGDEWRQLATTIWAEMVTDGLYSVEEVEAMMDPEQHEASWLPNGHFLWVVSLGGFVGPALVSSVDVLQRDDGTAVLEQLAVHPLQRGHGYARQVVRDAVSVVQRNQLKTLEVFALEKEGKAVAFWRHLLGAEPNAEGHAVFLGTHPAKGWRLPSAEISV